MTLPVPRGSIAIWNHQMARRLSAVRKVIIFASMHKGQKPFDEHDGVSCVRVPANVDATVIRLLQKLPLWFSPSRPVFASMLSHLAYIVRVVLHARRIGCRVLHVHNLSQFAPIAAALHKEARIVLHMHCEWLTQLDPQMIWGRLALCNMVIGCSGRVSSLAAERFDDLSGRIRCLHNGVDVSTFKASPQRRSRDKLLFIGRLSPEKGVHRLIEALQLVLKRRPGATLRIIGSESKTPREMLVRLSKDPMVRGLDRFYGKAGYMEQLRGMMPPETASRVQFAGRCDNDKLSDAIADSDLVVLPSLSDTFPLTILEAMACGRAVVATRVGGCPEEVEHGKTGLIVEPDNPAALADAMVTLLEDDELRNSMGVAGRERAEHLFDWSRVAGKLNNLYREILDGVSASQQSTTVAQPLVDDEVRSLSAQGVKTGGDGIQPSF
ncbi:MAG: glycosyltransferase family 4 protein [Planctomycetes bacterium]|nr:glycosyltransferase family 4 protein [Planctomycetota bacterium]